MSYVANSLESEAPPLVVQDNGDCQEILKGLKPYKTSRPDEISSCFLKEMEPSILPVLSALTLIFQASLVKAQYSKCSKISNTFLFLFSNKMLVFRAGIHKFLVRVANREENPDQTASSEAV